MLLFATLLVRGMLALILLAGLYVVGVGLVDMFAPMEDERR